MPISLKNSRGFLTVLVPAALGGAVWERSGLPLGWLMGAAIVAGTFAISDWPIQLPKFLYYPALVAIGSSVGLVINPAVVAEMSKWVPVMIGSAFLGMAAAALVTPMMARLGRMTPSTAFFSLLPGGVIEMAKIGEENGADSTIVAALHTVRVALVVGLLPLILFFYLPATPFVTEVEDTLSPVMIGIVLTVGMVGGFLGTKLGMPASWLLGAVIAVGVLASSGFANGALPSEISLIAQVLVGMSLGARFKRKQLSAIPRALAVGTPALLLIMSLMAVAGSGVAMATLQPIASLVLCFSIGGMAEMVLTAKALEQNIALVAAFQAVRGVAVNTLAASVWRRLSQFNSYSDKSKG